MSDEDLECGGGVSGEEEEEEDSVCFSDDYSTADGEASYDEILEASGALESRKASLMADYSDSPVDIDVESGGVGGKRADMRRIERDCRICHLSLVSRSPGLGVAIELGCCCKDDLAAAHRHCAETWFKIKGNKTCEICNSVARNIVGPNDIEALQEQTGDNGATSATATSSAVAQSTSETRSCLNGHRFLNLLLACMVFAFVISWLFHFKIPS
ncbi:hypothetical protein F511_21567 [Dorcoceras hygrometricum]|uniref:RING-CH-type domain-containing protein n=1 Tax=Dorcoceras hygrometricum TaxID=472368 RepID=A0A2Z7AHG4_9LAMI|nr:hypothetical protein F511_21567 [Dorcoceras hygrometricum]